MIHLTRLNNQPITVNSDLIKFVEQAPDTVITLLSGEKIVVREKAVEVVNRVLEFRRSVLQGIFPVCDQVPQRWAKVEAIAEENKAPSTDHEEQR